MATLLQDTAWGILTLATTITAWRIQPALGADTAWQIEAMLNSSTAWAVTGGIRQRVAWKMIENENDIPGINSHTVTVTIAGTVVEPNSISLSADTDSLSWSAQLALPDEVAFNLCTTGTEVSISIDGMTWALKIKHRDKSRSYPAEQWSAVAVSAFALNADDPVSLILESETLVSEVAATIAGMNVLWLIDNWRLPTGLKISEASSRRDVLRSLADAAGAVVSSRPDGTLVVLPGTPTDAAIATSRAQWFVADTININRDVLPRNTYKRVLCGSEGLYLPREISLQVTATDDEARTVKIGVWIAPDPIEPTVTNAGPSTITVHKNHYVSEEVTEKVSFINGLGSVARPIDLYRSADWGAHENLGAVSVIGETQPFWILRDPFQRYCKCNRKNQGNRKNDFLHGILFRQLFFRFQEKGIKDETA